MPTIDVDALLLPVTGDDPCGPDLEYDPEMRELEQSAQGKPEQHIGETFVPAEEPDWRDVRQRALALFDRTKDLRVAAYLVRALLRTSAFPGLADGLAVVRGLVEQHWEPLHPRLDPDDDNDPTMRVNIVMGLCDPEDFLGHVRNTPLVSAAALGRFSLRDLQLASGEAPPTASETPASMASIEGAFLEADLESLTLTAQSLDAALEHLRELESRITDHVGSSSAPNLDPLRRMIFQAAKIVKEKVAMRTGGEAPSGAESLDGQAPAGAPGAGRQAGQALTGEIRSREDVVRALDKIIDYYQRSEPSSPLPILVRRCKRLVTAGFEDIVKNLIPDGLTQLESIKGPQEDA